jgi:hypothetical protein
MKQNSIPKVITKNDSTRRHRQYEKRLRSILKAASQVIAKEGFEGASVRDVAAPPRPRSTFPASTTTSPTKTNCYTPCSTTLSRPCMKPSRVVWRRSVILKIG